MKDVKYETNLLRSIMASPKNEIIHRISLYLDAESWRHKITFIVSKIREPFGKILITWHIFHYMKQTHIHSWYRYLMMYMDGSSNLYHKHTNYKQKVKFPSIVDLMGRTVWISKLTRMESSVIVFIDGALTNFWLLKICKCSLFLE